MRSKYLLIALLTLTGATSALAQTTALKNVHVIDVNALKVIDNQTVVIEKNLIKAIFDTSAAQTFESDVRVIDMSGKYLLPGLIDTHVHHATSPDDSDNDEVTQKRLHKLLLGGVTTVRDMGGDTRALSSLKRRADNDVIPSPDIYYSVIIGGQEFFSDPRTVASAKGETPGQVDWMRAVNQQTNFDEVMLRTIGTGATGIKIYARVGSELIPKLAAAAKSRGLKVWAHAFVGPARPDDAVTGGVETISHAPDLSAQVVQNFYEQRRKGVEITKQQQTESFELERYDHLIADMQKNNTILDATLTVFEARKDQSERGALMYEWGTTFSRLAHKNGIRISTGTDATSDYLNKDYPLVHHEMHLLVEDVGLTPLEAIQSATLIGAEVIGIADTHGSIEPGKVANLLIVNKDPTSNIKHLLDTAHVIKNGQFISLDD